MYFTYIRWGPSVYQRFLDQIDYVTFASIKLTDEIDAVEVFGGSQERQIEFVVGRTKIRYEARNRACIQIQLNCVQIYTLWVDVFDEIVYSDYQVTSKNKQQQRLNDLEI